MMAEFMVFRFQISEVTRARVRSAWLMVMHDGAPAAGLRLGGGRVGAPIPAATASASSSPSSDQLWSPAAAPSDGTVEAGPATIFETAETPARTPTWNWQPRSQVTSDDSISEAEGRS